MNLKTIVVGPMAVNCYILEDKNEAIIIDPGYDYQKIKKILDKNSITPKFIVHTHGHIDHIGADSEFNLPIYIHRLDKDCLTDTGKNLAAFLGIVFKLKKEQIVALEDKEIIKLNGINLEVIHTPGHTPGSISLKIGNIILTGDTLFASGIGRTDFPGASQAQLMKSIKTRLLIYPDSTKIFPGHGPESTIGQEKKNNPFLI